MNWQHTILYCALFVLGQGLYLLNRTAYAIRNPLNPISSRRQFLKQEWDVLLFRAGLDQILFWAWATWPDGISRLLTWMGSSWKFDLPLNGITAILGGLMAELLLDAIALKVGALGFKIPPVQAAAMAAVAPKPGDVEPGKLVAGPKP